MKNQHINKILTTMAFLSIGFLSVSALAGQDEAQRQLTQKVTQAKQKLEAAEAAKGSEREKLMSEHMKMMHEIMGKMEAMKPKAGMTMEEHEAWINEHQKLMDDMMGQMMKEHHMQMDMCKMPMKMDGMEDMHKQ